MAVTGKASGELAPGLPLRLGGMARLAVVANRWLSIAVWVLSLTFFAVLMGMVGIKSVFLGSDSVMNYARVWYLDRLIFHDHTFDWHVRYLVDGKALTFPYGVVPWLATVPFYHLFGDRAVTLSFLAGILFYFYAATRARPALADPRMLAIMALSSLLVASQLLGMGIANGEAFRFMRKALGLRAADLAGMLGVDAATVSRWETGKVPVDRAALATLAAAATERLDGRDATLERLRALREGKKPARQLRVEYAQAS